MFRSLNPAQERNPGAGLLSGVQNALSGFPLKTCLHAEVRRFGTQACGNDNCFCGRIFKVVSKQLLLSMLVLVSFDAIAQSSRPNEEKPIGSIVPERPDQTNAPDLVPRGYLQLETGFVREQDKVGNVTTVNYLFNTSLFRYGLSDNFELRLQIDYAGQNIEYPARSTLIHGFNPVTVGSKIFICEQERYVPKTSFVVSLSLPYFGKNEFRPSFVAPSFLFLFENEISERLSFGYNLGLKWDGKQPNATGVVTGSLGISVSEVVGVFVEGYFYATEKSGPDYRADCGLSVLLSRNLMVDLSGGVGVNEKAPDSFVSFGLSWRLPD